MGSVIENLLKKGIAKGNSQLLSESEIKAHINFTRSPNKMEPDVHTCLSFFHL